ncbi:MAG: hypothetical protein J6U35_00790, partial [Clostridia bacterium]|nr:hypothetical protein [Clostridia bacterium]
MQTENYFCGNTEKVPENAKDSIENSIAPVIGEEPEDADDNPFIRAEESEAYKKLEREYREYRTKKVLSRVDGLITGAAPAPKSASASSAVLTFPTASTRHCPPMASQKILTASAAF